MRRLSRWTVLALLAISSATRAEVRKTSNVSLLAPDGVVGDAFGTSLALDGSTLAVGAPGADGAAGAVYVFVRNGGSFALEQRLVLTAPAAGDALGRSLALVGDTLVAGAPGRSEGRGAAAVFTRAAGTWTQTASVVGTDTRPGDAFGASVALDGATLAVGAPGHDLRKAKDAGAAYVFTGAGAAWTQQAELTARKPQRASAFGAAVDVDGDAVVVGAPSFDRSKNAPDVGAGYLFTRSGTSWSGGDPLVVEGRLGYRDALGTAVAIDGDTIALGAPKTITFRDGANESGAVYVLRRSGGSATQEAELGNFMTALDHRGTALALDGDRIFSGAPRTPFRQFSADASANGYVQSWQRSGTAWSRLAQLDDVPARPEDALTGLGTSVAVAGNLVAAGGPEMRSRQGVVFLFESTPPKITTQPFATPTRARVLDPVRFRAAATDPEGDTISFAWTFDEMPFRFGFVNDVTLATTDTTQTFRIPGPHTGRFVAGDGIGASSAVVDFEVLPATHGFTSITFAEEYASKPFHTSEGNDPREQAHWQMEAVLDLAGVDVGAFTSATEFHLAMGDFDVRHTLGDDPTWTTGKTSAKLQGVEVLSPDEGGPDLRIVFRTIDADWSGGRLRFTVDDQAAEYEHASYDRWVVGRRHVFVPTSPIAADFTGALVFGPSTGAFRVHYAGKTKTTGKETGDTYTIRTSMSVKSTGFENL